MLHEVIREHSMAAARRIKEEGGDNDLLERLRNDPAFAAIAGRFDELVNPRDFIGRAPEQVTEFLNECVRPVLEAYRSEWEQAGGEEVTV